MANPRRQAWGWVLDPRATGGFTLACALLVVVNLVAYFLVADLRHLVVQGMNEANQHRQADSAAALVTIGYLYAGIVMGNMLALCVLAGAMLLANRTVKKRAEVETALRQSHDKLETRVLQRTMLLTRVNEVLQGEIVDHRRAEERASRLAALVEFSDDAIVGLDFEGRITAWNPGAERLCSYRADEVSGRPLSLLVHSDRPETTDALVARTTRGESVPPFETVCRRKDGSETHVSLSIAPVRDASGGVVGAAAVARDITERLRLEAQLRQAAKMEAIGRLAAGVAHDFNNLLTVILGSCDLLLASLPKESSEHPVVEEIAKAGERAAAMTRQLLAFSRQQPLAPTTVDLNLIVSGMSSMLPRLLGREVELSVHLWPAPIPVFADAAQLEQVLLNLAVNARDAMPGGGKLTLETQEVFLDETYVRLHEGMRTGTYVLLAVSDTGCGMSPDVRAHLFEPFFTTKEKGKGTGLGLAMVYGIVRQSGGHIAVYSELAQGTSVKVYLPRRQLPSASAVAPSAELAPIHGGSETVLLVEDDVSVRSLVGRVLRQHGYRVLESENGEEGLEVAAGLAAPIDLLVTDIVMPGISGRQLAERLVESRPQLKVLFLSGYPEHAVVRRGALDTVKDFLQKPFSPDALARKVRAMLDDSPPFFSQGSGVGSHGSGH